MVVLEGRAQADEYMGTSRQDSLHLQAMQVLLHRERGDAMKAIIKYLADDGTEWTNEQSCQSRDALVRNIQTISMILPARPDAISFTNGEGFIQHDEDHVQRYRNALLDQMPNEKWVQETREGKRHVSHLARILSDGPASPLTRAWFRLMDIDDKFREWGQPYFAANPHAGKQICLNPK